MAETWRMTARQRAILTAIIESYIETGEPVGSGTIARLNREGPAMSPATIRNEMAELAEAGLLEQPHTSAGRIPTARAFRMYVEQLSQGDTPRANSEHLRLQIDRSFV
ncbi:MAG TPA: heat-inducible transcription repressor HrcA, partial [Edaphobacter sp.]|nr:heat-inducible transcription repressor HrcA [Edaphobacter sp.]